VKLTRTPAELYRLAAKMAPCIPLVAKGQAQEKAADEVMTTLVRAASAGFRDVGRLEADPALEPVRQREDFRKLVALLRAKEKTGGK
jgi:hypothetical protein